MGAPSPPPQKVETTTAPVKVAKAEPMSQSTEERQSRANNKKLGRKSLIVNRGGAQGLGGGDDNASIKKRTLG